MNFKSRGLLIIDHLTWWLSCFSTPKNYLEGWLSQCWAPPPDFSSVKIWGGAQAFLFLTKFREFALFLFLDHSLRTAGLTDTLLFHMTAPLCQGSASFFMPKKKKSNNIPFIFFFVCFLIFGKYCRVVPKEVFLSSFLWNTARQITLSRLQMYTGIQLDLCACFVYE